LPRIDQAARDERLDVLASRGIDGFSAECEVRTITGNALGRLGNVVVGPVEFPEPERLHDSHVMAAQRLDIVGLATDE